MQIHNAKRIQRFVRLIRNGDIFIYKISHWGALLNDHNHNKDQARFEMFSSWFGGEEMEGNGKFIALTSLKITAYTFYLVQLKWIVSTNSLRCNGKKTTEKFPIRWSVLFYIFRLFVFTYSLDCVQWLVPVPMCVCVSSQVPNNWSQAIDDNGNIRMSEWDRDK